MFNLSGKKALVIGGSRGIGAAIVRRLVDDNAAVCFTWSGSQQKAEDLASQTSAKAVQTDVTDDENLATTIQNYSPLDIFVFNAGVLIHGDPLTIDKADIDHMINVNLRAAYHATIEAARHMVNGGRIIIIGSTNAQRVPFKGISAYSMTKSAIESMVRGLARDFGDRHITVNTIEPGPTDTDMNPANGPMSSAMLDAMAIKQFATADDIAAYVSFLASPEARGITGSMQRIDGGFSA